MHDQITELLDSVKLTHEQTKELKVYLTVLWAKNEKVRVEKMVNAEKHLLELKAKKNNLLSNLDLRSKLHKDMEETIEDVKKQIDSAEITLAQIKTYDHDFNEFVAYALDLVSNWVTYFWSLDKETMRRCKQLLFSGVVMLDLTGMFTLLLLVPSSLKITD